MPRPSIDSEISKKFGNLVILARNGSLDNWLDDIWSILALIVLLDQFTRNIYRHSVEMYSGDLKAQCIVSYIFII